LTRNPLNPLELEAAGSLLRHLVINISILLIFFFVLLGFSPWKYHISTRLSRCSNLNPNSGSTWTTASACVATRQCPVRLLRRASRRRRRSTILSHLALAGRRRTSFNLTSMAPARIPDLSTSSSPLRPHPWASTCLPRSSKNQSVWPSRNHYPRPR
jgi:hypothetical protein